MSRVRRLQLLTLLSSLALPTAVFAQKGTGETAGVARQSVTPPVVTLSGKLSAMKAGPCEYTSGRSPVGMHLILQRDDGGNLDIHLGPNRAIDHVIDQFTVGQSLSIEAFRTDELPDDAYIAKALLLDDKVIHLRDDNLHPSWAYSPIRGQGTGRDRAQRRGRWGSCW